MQPCVLAVNYQFGTGSTALNLVKQLIGKIAVGKEFMNIKQNQLVQR